MKTYRDMLTEILKSSGWSQQYLAIRLGVSFPTVNYWLNNKVVPRKSMQKRIRNLYIARNIPYEGPVYITLQLPDASNVKIGDEILLFKADKNDPDNYEVVGFKREDLEVETSSSIPVENLTKPDSTIPAKSSAERGSDPVNSAQGLSAYTPISVAWTKGSVIFGTKPAFRIHDRIYPGAYARIMFIVGKSAIAVIEDWGLEVG